VSHPVASLHLTTRPDSSVVGKQAYGTLDTSHRRALWAVRDRVGILKKTTAWARPRRFFNTALTGGWRGWRRRRRGTASKVLAERLPPLRSEPELSVGDASELFRGRRYRRSEQTPRAGLVYFTGGESLWMPSEWAGFFWLGPGLSALLLCWCRRYGDRRIEPSSCLNPLLEPLALRPRRCRRRFVIEGRNHSWQTGIKRHNLALYIVLGYNSAMPCTWAEEPYG